MRKTLIIVAIAASAALPALANAQTMFPFFGTGDMERNSVQTGPIYTGRSSSRDMYDYSDTKPESLSQHPSGAPVTQGYVPYSIY